MGLLKLLFGALTGPSFEDAVKEEFSIYELPEPKNKDPVQVILQSFFNHLYNSPEELGDDLSLFLQGAGFGKEINQQRSVIVPYARASFAVWSTLVDYCQNDAGMHPWQNFDLRVADSQIKTRITPKTTFQSLGITPEIFREKVLPQLRNNHGYLQKIDFQETKPLSYLIDQLS